MESLGQPLWIGKYRLTSRIATGGMAEVYVGRHISDAGEFGPMVAVKKLLPHLVKDSSIVRMFLNEARITAQIHHPNVVGIHELGQVDGEPFIAMELLEGRTFAELRTRAAEEARRVPLPVALRVLTEACRGLDAAHRAVDDSGQPLALVHRDFTPDNIHVGVSGEVKVIDFGVARTSSWSSGTEPGTLKGKFFYMSPEMILARAVDHRADLFAAGVMLYEQLCGRRPFTGISVEEVVMKIAEGRPQAPRAYDPSVPADLEAVCLKALQRSPADRFPSLQEFVAAIEAIGGDGRVARAEEVGAYVGSLFPVQSDPRRQTLRKAREADPSHPAVPLPRPSAEAGGEETVARAPSPELLRRGTPRPSHQSQTVARPASEELLRLSAPDASPPPQQTAPQRRPLRKGPLVGAAVAAALVLGVGGYFALRGSATAAGLLAEAEAQQDPEARARRLVSVASAPDVTDAQLARAGQLLLEGKRWEDALTVTALWTARSPKSFEAWVTEAKAATQQRMGKRAEAAIKEAGALKPHSSTPDVLTAELREAQGEAPAALEAWTQAAKKRPHDAKIRARQGYWLSQAGRLDDAAEVLSAALKRGFDADAAAELGFVKYRKEQLPEALALLKRAVQAKPDSMTGHYYLATALYTKGDIKGARAEYDAADRLAGADPRPLSAWCEMEQHQESGSELEAVKKRIHARFPAEEKGLLMRCAP